MNKSKVILLLSLLTLAKYRSQVSAIDKNILNVASPEVASIMKYADFPELDYIGKTNISIPIYDINFGKLKIPIGLSYNTKGNKAADIATSVGLGWNLNAGGNLTAKVNDMNDFTETYSYYTTSSFEPEQSLAWHRQSKGYLTTDWPQALIDTQVSSSQLCINHRIWEADDVFIDAAPDFYYINAPGFNDKFYLTRLNDSQLKSNFFKSTNAKLKNNPNLIIKTTCGGMESTAWGSQGIATVFYQPDKFEIVGENGYIYTFNDFEASLITEYPLDFFSYTNIQVNNWYLTKVKDPFSGNEINYEYESFTNNYEHLSLLSLYNYYDFGNYNVFSSFAVGTLSYDAYNAVHLVYNKLTSSKLGAKRLKKITTDNETIDFSYAIARLDYGGNALSGITIKNKKGSTIKQANFSYSYFDSNNCSSGDYECKRLKLNSIEDSSLGTYILYYDNNTFPPRNTSKTDFLGYFNNNNSNINFSKTDFHPYNYNYYPLTKTYFYPDLAKDNIFPFELKNKTAYGVSNQIDRTPSSNSKLGLLKRIIYPTGGSLDLDYENDDFIYEGYKYILGSTRISNMKLYDSQNAVSKEIKYKYISTDNTSSGQINFITTPEETTRLQISSGIGFDTGAIIGYSRIIEETTGKGYVEKKFTNFNDYPDKFMETDQVFSNQADKNFFKFMKFPNSYIQSFDDRRGKLLAVNYYKEGQISPLKKEEYSYDYQVKNSLKLTKLFRRYANFTSTEHSASNYLLTYFNNPKTSSKEDFYSGGNIREESTFSYDDARLTYKKTISSGDIMEEYYRNAKDKSIQKLIDANILDTPIEVEKKKNGKILAKQEVKYENSANLLPSSQQSYNVEKNNMETEINYDQYDSKGNLQKYTTKDGLSTVIIWGYNQSLPIAKIEGKDAGLFLTMFNTDITALSIASNSDIDSASEELFKAKLNAFQKRQFNLDVSITTYTHDPLIGVTSITPPLGIKENYKYDTANRLERVSNADNSIIKEFKYNYKEATKYSNTLQYKLFYKNNCSNGYASEPYLYTVFANTYASYFSQADADQMALNDINTNGQNIANENLVCKSNCSITFFNSISASLMNIFSTDNPNKVHFELKFNSGNVLDWQWKNGASIGTIQGLCKPASLKIINYTEPASNSLWQIRIDTLGNISAKLISGSYYSTITFQFEYNKN